MKKQILFAFALVLALSAKAQFDTTGITTWNALHNSSESWMQGAFEAGRDANDAFDFGWGYYDMSTHVIGGDSIYIIKTINDNYKAISIDQMASGVYTITFSDLDGNNKTTKNFTRSNYANKNFFYYSIDTDTEKDLEPATQDWDIVFTRYAIIFPGFGAYPVAGVLSNIGVETSQVEFAQGGTYSVADTAQFPMTSNISNIGYDWKSAGMSGVTIHDTLVYYVKDQTGAVNELKLTGYGGSGTGNFKFEVNGVVDSISLTAGNVNQVYYSLAAGDTVYTNTDNDWDIAFYAQSSFSSIPVRINEVSGTALYIYPNVDISYWNTMGVEENQFNVVSVYPNPATDVINVVLSDFDADLSIEVIDMNGRVVKTQGVLATSGINETQVNVNGLNSGMYIVRVSGNQTVATAQVLVK